MQDNFSIRNWKNKTVHKEEYDAGAAKVQEQEDDIELEIPGETPTVDKTVQAKASKQDKVIKAYKDITAQMQSALNAFKTADTDEAKETAKLALKQLTPEFQAAKQAYEKLKGVKL